MICNLSMYSYKYERLQIKMFLCFKNMGERVVGNIQSRSFSHLVYALYHEKYDYYTSVTTYKMHI